MQIKQSKKIIKRLAIHPPLIEDGRLLAKIVKLIIKLIIKHIVTAITLYCIKKKIKNNLILHFLNIWSIRLFNMLEVLTACGEKMR